MTNRHSNDSIYRSLEHTNISSSSTTTMSDVTNCIDLSHLRMTDHDLQGVIKSLSTKQSMQYDDITSIDLSNNALTDASVRDLLILFKNLRLLNLSNSGIAPSNMTCISASISIIWFDEPIDDEDTHSDDSFDFMDDDDEEDDDVDSSNLTVPVFKDEESHNSESEIDDFMDFEDTIEHENSLSIEYSLNLHAV